MSWSELKVDLTDETWLDRWELTWQTTWKLTLTTTESNVAGNPPSPLTSWQTSSRNSLSRDLLSTSQDVTSRVHQTKCHLLPVILSCVQPLQPSIKLNRVDYFPCIVVKEDFWISRLRLLFLSRSGSMLFLVFTLLLQKSYCYTVRWKF